MAELLLELFSEEIPARMQAQAAKDLERLVVGALSDRGLLFEGSKAFAGSRRLTLVASGLPVKQPDVSEEKKGPRVGAPEKAVEGFLRSAGVTLDQCEKRNDGKGEFYVAVIHRKGRATQDVLAEILPECFAKLPWPKSMRWIPNNPVRWVRPLHSILAVFDGDVVPFEFAGVKSGATTKGHRFLSTGVITAKTFEIYRNDLKHHHVMLDAEERKETILTDAKNKAFALGLELIEDRGLLDEVAGLNEWPTVLIGTIEDQFMDVPAEILQTSMRVHQKYFSLRDPKTGKFANKFAVVSNMTPEDGGKQIVAGNERVLRARLSDAKFFWDQDRQHRLDSRIDKLKGIVFHAKLGTQYERVERIVALAAEIAGKIGADIEKAKHAALLCKADLTTGVVGEFPELQGVMGRYYALHDKYNSDVADAIRDHYKPVGPSDAVPTSTVSIAVALADKLDQLSQFFAVGEKPTGSGDPFALRRAALGVIRIILENGIRLPLGVSDELLSFFADRLKVALKEKGTRHDLIDAVFSLGNEDDLVRLVARVEALQSFLKSEEGADLLAGYKRAANILKAEEKKDKTTFDGTPVASALVLPEEKALFADLDAAAAKVKSEIAAERFVEAMGVMASLRAPVDAFFDKVTVNDKDPALRKNRLLLLSRLRATLHLVADFSKIEG
ncbi:glycine--tRNA ligase subunit beta [Rhizomicrobium electricum]|uniref:Glycine--tRNA ligase beta subunit n=1 Tax=Rhizomicrobium electricum TaxID=480070 RepID=A0ABN1DZX0_9PROT|nr:glycine--tRNA ligase subunit beta [Rhizomicrobium electricum]NIJ47309.1 glycyl-tRNA synthetase beta chain [Rhizomicrobium electricum]